MKELNPFGKGKLRYSTTGQVARQNNIHANTVRIYENWGYISPVPRAKNGYRRFTPLHSDQVKLIRLAINFTWLSGRIRKLALGVIISSARGELERSLTFANSLEDKIKSAVLEAELALKITGEWRDKSSSERHYNEGYFSGGAARLLDTTKDTLRTWERNGLIRINRTIPEKYRIYFPRDIKRLKVISALRKAGYSIVSIRRMLLKLENDAGADIRYFLDTPSPDEAEDLVYATDRWLSKVKSLNEITPELVNHVEYMIKNYC